MSESRYYWLKLKRDFFKRHDIQIIEAMPNGKDYILFYLKLLCESVDHDGSLRFSEQIPYSDDMLSTVTRTNVDIVRSAVKVFTELGMMEILDDGTLFMNEVERMIGSAADNDNANRQRRYRENQKQLALRNVTECVTKSNESKSKKKSKSKNIYYYGEYENVGLTDEERIKLDEQYGPDLVKKAIDWFDAYIEEKGYKCKSHYLAMKRWVFTAVKEQESRRPAETTEKYEMDLSKYE